jgi:nitroreductase
MMRIIIRFVCLYIVLQNFMLEVVVVAFIIISQKSDYSVIRGYRPKLNSIHTLSATTPIRVVTDGQQQQQQGEEQLNGQPIQTESYLDSSSSLDVDTAINARYACKKFLRYDGLNSTNMTTTTTPIASTSNPKIVQLAFDCLNIARLAPSSYNTQPYKMIMVHTPEQKNNLSYCVLGPNKQRVLDSDCTVLFLADKHICCTFPKYIDFIKKNSKLDRIPNKNILRSMMLQITIFSSGIPLPRIIASPITFISRIIISIINWFTKSFYPLPSLSSAETWTTKQIMLVVMTYLLSCTSHGLATIPMEGINAGLLRQKFNIPTRYSIPVIVSTGVAYHQPTNKPVSDITTRRYPLDEMIFDDTFGKRLAGVTSS